MLDGIEAVEAMDKMILAMPLKLKFKVEFVVELSIAQALHDYTFSGSGYKMKSGDRFTWQNHNCICK